MGLRVTGGQAQQQGRHHGYPFHLLNPVSDNEIIHDESEPAEGKDCDREENLADKSEFGFLEDVEDAPDGNDETKPINDFH
jgi:hypothetical protein